MVIAIVVILGLAHPSLALGQQTLPPSVARGLNKAYDHLENGRINQAVSLIGDMQQKGMDHYLVWFALGNAYMMAEKYQKAKSAYGKTIERKEDYAPAWYNMARCFMALKQDKEAGNGFLKAYDLSTDKNPETLYYASYAYFTGDQPQRALNIFQQLTSRHGQQIKLEWKATLARIYLALRQPGKAISLFEELARNTTGNEKKQWQEVLLHQYLSLEMNQKALNYVKRLNREDPLEPKWWKGLVHIHLLEDHYKAALVSLTVYGYLVKLSDEEKKLMADLSLSLDMPAESIDILEEVLSVKWDTRTLEKLVQSYRLRHQPEKALEWVKKGLKRDESNKDLLMLKGNLLFELSAWEEAMAVFQQLTQMDPALGQAWLMLGYAAWNAEKLETAYRAMERAGSFEAQRKPAGEAMRRIKAMVCPR